MQGLSPVFLSVVGFFSFILYSPCCAFSVATNTIVTKWSTRTISQRLSQNGVQLFLGNRLTKSFLFSVMDENPPDNLPENLTEYFPENPTVNTDSDERESKNTDNVMDIRSNDITSRSEVDLPPFEFTIEDSDSPTIFLDNNIDEKDERGSTIFLPVLSDDDDRAQAASLYKDIYSIALPALAACIVEPALSLVDTYYVGKSAATGTLGLAGMSVNSALFNIIAAATAPLGTGTTAVISKMRGLEEQQQSVEDKNSKAIAILNGDKNVDVIGGAGAAGGVNKAGNSVGTVFLNGICLATFAGTLLSAVILLFGKPFIRQTFQINGEFLSTTVGYLKIRGLSLPAVLLNYIVFGFSIAMQDIIAPVLSIVTAFLVNVFGDHVLVGRMGYGLSGAAAATTVSSYLGSFVALTHIFKRHNIKIPRVARLTAEVSDTSSMPNIENKENNNYKTNGNGKNGKNGRKNKIDWGELLNRKGISMFFSASGPLLIGAMVNTLTYSAGARIASFTSIPAQATLEIAAHQIVMQSWWFLSYFSSPFSLVAQAVIPKDLIKNDKKRVKKMISLLLKVTGVVGVLVTLCNILLISSFPNTFTKNVEIQRIFRGVLIPSSVSLFIVCLSTVSDGVFIGCNLISDYLKASVFSTVAAWIYYMYSIKNKIGIVGAWNGLLIFSVVRMGFYLTRFKNLWSTVTQKELDISNNAKSLF